MSEDIKIQAVASDLEVKEVIGLEKVERVLDDDVLLLIRPINDGSQKCYSVRGRDFHGEDAYQIAIKNGFVGTYEEWQDAVKKVVDVQPLADNLVSATENAQNATADAISATEAIRLVIEQVNAAEAIRTSNENERQTNESSRKSAEDNRQSAEDNRKSAEETRQENETVRAMAEDKREADFQTSKEAADKATDKALSTYSHPPRVDSDGYYYVWNPDTQSYNKTETNLTGKAFSIKKVFASVADMEATDVNIFAENDFILINTVDVEDEDNAKLYVVAIDADGSKFYSYLVDMSGFRGFTGKTPQLIIGNVESLGEDEEAAASITYDGVDSDGNPVYKVNFGIPRGYKLRFADLSTEDKAELMAPATEAAKKSDTQTKLCKEATDNSVLATEASKVQTEQAKDATDLANDAATNANTATDNSVLATEASKVQTDLSKEISEHPTKVGDNGNWWAWNTITKEYEDTGEIAKGGMLYPSLYLDGNELYLEDNESNAASHLVVDDNALFLVM